MSASGQIAEVFRSWQGEGLLVGRRQVFVRLVGCTVDCRYCDTAWAFTPPARVEVPGRPGHQLPNPLSVADVVGLVRAAEGGAPPCPVSLTGGEPCEQPGFAAALMDALAPRGVLLETSGLHLAALGALVPRARWVACDLKLPTATGRADVLDRHEEVLRSGVLRGAEVFFKLVADGDTPAEEVDRVARLVARHAPGCPVFLQPVTPRGPSPALSPERLEALADVLSARGLDLRVLPQVHPVLGVR